MHTDNNKTICSTQSAHRTHTICTHTNTEHNMQHNQDTENTETEHTIQNTDTLAQPQHKCITYDLHIYSFYLYHEQIYIKNSNTIELYTISKENI